jgi:hypothetical protein
MGGSVPDLVQCIIQAFIGLARGNHKEYPLGELASALRMEPRAIEDSSTAAFRRDRLVPCALTCYKRTCHYLMV